MRRVVITLCLANFVVLSFAQAAYQESPLCHPFGLIARAFGVCDKPLSVIVPPTNLPAPTSAQQLPANGTTIRATSSDTVSEQPIVQERIIYQYVTQPTITNIIREVVQETIIREEAVFPDQSRFVTRDLLSKQSDRTSGTVNDNIADLGESLTTNLLTVSGNSTLDGDLTVAGASMLAGLTVSGATTLNSLTTNTLQSNNIFLPASTPTSTASRLYNTAGDLYWNGSLIAGGAVGSWNSSGDDIYRLTGNVGVGTSTPSSKLDVAGFVNVDQFSGYKQNGDTILFASSTNFSVFAGTDAGFNVLDTSRNNTALGYQALYTATSSDFNTAIGTIALYSNTSGFNNTAVGNQALYSNTSGFYNTAIGNSVMNDNTTGSTNVAVGDSAMYYNTTGSSNTAMGFVTLNENTTGSSNTALGRTALQRNTTGSENTAVGRSALNENVTGSNNTAVGRLTLLDNIDGSFNTAIGRLAGSFLTDGSTSASSTDNSLYLGALTEALTANDQNTIVIGYAAEGLGSNTVVLGNDSIVTTALKGNIGIGTTTPLARLTVGAGNFERIDGVDDLYVTDDVEIDGSLFAAGVSTFEDNLLASAFKSLVDTSAVLTGDTDVNIHLDEDNDGDNNFNIRDGDNNVIFRLTENGLAGFGTTTPGSHLTVAGDINLTGSLLFAGTALSSHQLSDGFNDGNNTYFASAGPAGTNGVDYYMDNNTALGINALVTLNTDNANADYGDLNAAFGRDALRFNTTGYQNSGLGHGALRRNLTGYENTAVGSRSFRYNRTGSNNVIIGSQAANFTIAGSNIESLSDSIYIGRDTLALNDSDTNSIVIGDTAWGIGSNSVVLGSTTIATTVLRGDIGIGTTSPLAKLMVVNTGTNPSLVVADELNDATPFTIDASGNVGVRTTTPLATMQIEGSGTEPTTTTRNSQLLITGESNSIEIGTSDTLNARYAWILARHADPAFGRFFSTLHLQPDVTGVETDYEGVAISYDPTIKLPSDVSLAVAYKVGIANTSPDQLLEVGGNIAQDAYLQLSSQGTNARGILFSRDSSVVEGQLIVDAGEDMYLSNMRANEPIHIQTDGGAGEVTRIYVEGSGEVGIGTTTPSAQLTVAGTVRFASLGSAGGGLITDALGNVTVSSDERLKDIQDTFESGLEAILELEPINYRWNQLSGMETEGTYTGFSAQNVASVLPEAVAEDSRGYLTLSDRPILAAVVNAIKELWGSVSSNQADIAALEAENVLLRERLEAIEASLSIAPVAESTDQTAAAEDRDSENVAEPEVNEQDALATEPATNTSATGTAQAGQESTDDSTEDSAQVDASPETEVTPAETVKETAAEADTVPESTPEPAEEEQIEETPAVSDPEVEVVVDTASNEGEV